MNFLDYPHRTLYGIVKQTISNNIPGTVKLVDTDLIQEDTWYAQSSSNIILEPGTEIRVVYQTQKILVVEPILS
ncbi:MAG: hypothetical protein QNJ37_07020 [Crocosphaera sp.]|nr:hypothetical protein [Crocosphaera sp.]